MLPDGVYRGRSTLDDDGINVGRAYEIAVEVAIEGDSVSLDFSGTSPQVRASINSSASQAFDAAIFALRLFLDKDIPSNSGLFRPITANFPRGSLLNPDPPHPCGGRMMAVYAVADALIQALSAATPQQRLAQSGMLLGYTIAGVAGPYWIHNAFDFGGVGAALGRDGIDGEGFHFGVGRNQIPQIEPVEAGCPILVESVEVIADSGGAGRWRGGLGVRVTHRLLADAVLSLRTDHVRYPPQGIDGGGAARPGGCVVVTSDGITTSLPTKIANVPVSAGSQFIVETSGGGGVGAANERDLEAVMIDVVEGKVTRDAARTVYGVVFDESGRPDPVATREYRRACD
jgi:N-methylhydantoinase B